MGAEAATTEALARLEHKVDLLFEILVGAFGAGGKFTFTPVGSEKHVCPLCHQPVTYQIDTIAKAVTRKCNCKTGKFAPIDLEAFAPPSLTPRKEKSDAEPERNGQEVGSSGHRGRGGGRR